MSGNTIFLSQKEKLPVRNVPVASLDIDLSGDFTANDVSTKISEALKRLDMIEGEDRVAIAFRWGGDPLHARLYALAQGIHQGLPKTVEDPEMPVVIMMDGDAGRTIGNILVKELNVEGEVISVDNVQLRDLDFVDIGEFMPDTQVVPLIIKSLLFTGPEQA